MLTMWGAPGRLCDGITRRDFLQAGALGLGGLTLADLLRLTAQGKTTPAAAQKSVIMICLYGGPSHLDMYDMKPNAPKEFRGEFSPIKTNVPGMDICELFPLQAKSADKLAIVRGLDYRFDDGHLQQMLYTGFGSALGPNGAIAGRMVRPSFGSVFSRLHGATTPHGLPSYVSLVTHLEQPFDDEKPAYAGTGHRPFSFRGQELRNLELPRGVNLDRLTDRKQLRNAFDTLRRDLDASGEMSGTDAFAARALEMVTAPKVREAFDLSREPDKVKAGYGMHIQESGVVIEPQKFLLARRLVEAGVRVVTVSVTGNAPGAWDTHDNGFQRLRKSLPALDKAIHALTTDLHERGLDKDVAVVVWGEMGRTPKVNGSGGRDHWPRAGFCLFCGGAGLKMGQVIGQTDARGGEAAGRPYTVQNVLATIYHVLGVDPATTLTDFSGRPQYLLDDREKINELL